MLVGARAVLIRGPSGAGKSRLALELLDAARDGRLRFARLVGDDRVHLESVNGRLLVRPAQPLAGLIELRGAGLLRRDHEPCAVVGLVVDLDAADAERLPDRQPFDLHGIKLPRLARRIRGGPLAGGARTHHLNGYGDRSANLLMRSQRPLIGDWLTIMVKTAACDRARIAG